MKQVIIVRADLKMRRGKEIAQGAHASMAATLPFMNALDDRGLYVKEWLAGLFTKIAVSVDSEAELLEAYDKAVAAGIPCSLIKDAGLTEFGGVPTLTAAGIGPAPAEILNPITGHLKLR